MRDESKFTNPLSRETPTAVYYGYRAGVFAAVAERDHIASLVARFRRETGGWPSGGAEVAQRYGAQQTVPGADDDHPALDYRLGDIQVRVLGTATYHGVKRARVLIAVPGLDARETLVAPDAVYPARPERL